MSFSVLMGSKAKMRSTVHNNRPNYLMVLHIYQKDIEKIDILKKVDEFIVSRDLRSFLLTQDSSYLVYIGTDIFDIE